MTNSFLSHAIGCQEASRMLGSSQPSVHLAAPVIRRAFDDKDNECTECTIFKGQRNTHGTHRAIETKKRL